MATLTIIVGLCGSGKTTILNQIAAAFPSARTMNEGFVSPSNERDQRERVAILEALRNGTPAIVGSFECMNADNRAHAMQQIRAEAPGTDFLWICIENDLELANENCRRDPKRDEAAATGHIRQNEAWSANYSTPDGAIILKMFAVAAN